MHRSVMFVDFFAAAAVVYIVFRREEAASRVGGSFANVWETMAASSAGLAVTHPPAPVPPPRGAVSHCQTPR